MKFCQVYIVTFGVDLISVDLYLRRVDAPTPFCLPSSLVFKLSDANLRDFKILREAGAVNRVDSVICGYRKKQYCTFVVGAVRVMW